MTGYESKKKAAQDKLEQAKEILLQHPQKDIDWQREQQIKAHTKLDEEGMYLVHQTAQPAQEPASITYKEVADAMNKLRKGTFEQRQIADEMENKRLYTSPPQRTWVGLTDKERSGIEDYCEMIIGKAAFDAIEAKLKEKNT